MEIQWRLLGLLCFPYVCTSPLLFLASARHRWLEMEQPSCDLERIYPIKDGKREEHSIREAGHILLASEAPSGTND